MHTQVTSVQFHGQRGTWPEDVVYVGMAGRASRAFAIPDSEGLFGKPWAVLEHPLGWQVGYLRYLTSRLAKDQQFESAVRALHSQRLACWCVAKDATHCHAFILAEFVELLWHSKECPTSRFDGQHAYSLCSHPDGYEHAACAICHAEHP